MEKEFISFTDDFMFCTVMEDKKKCKELLERILNIKITKINTVCKQKNIKNKKDAKAIRLDVYITDIDGNQYNIEMQTYKEPFIGKRTRYYHSEMDGYIIKKGANYSNLKKNIVIFICTYDPFGDNRSVYTFKNVCVENKDIFLNDDIETIILNAYGDRENVDDKLTKFLDYVKTGKAEDNFTKDINKSVVVLNNDDDWRDRHMTFEMKMDEKYEAGKMAGIELGKELGIEFGKELEKLESIRSLMKSLDCTADKAMDILLIDDKDREMLMEKLNSKDI